MRSEEEIRELIKTFEKAIKRTEGRVDYEETRKRAVLRQKIKLLKWVMEV